MLTRRRCGLHDRSVDRSNGGMMLSNAPASDLPVSSRDAIGLKLNEQLEFALISARDLSLR